MTQPRPLRGRPFRLVAAQLRGQPGDQHRVLRVAAVPGQVLTFPFAVDQHRLDAHHRQLERVALIQHRAPAVPGRLARHHQPGEPRRRCGLPRPLQRVGQLPCARLHRPATHDLAVVVAHGEHLLLIGQVNPDDGVLPREQLPQPSLASVATSISTRRSDTVNHDILLCAVWDTKPDNRTRGMSLWQPPTGTY